MSDADNSSSEEGSAGGENCYVPRRDGDTVPNDTHHSHDVTGSNVTEATRSGVTGDPDISNPKEMVEGRELKQMNEGGTGGGDDRREREVVETSLPEALTQQFSAQASPIQVNINTISDGCTTNFADTVNNQFKVENVSVVNNNSIKNVVKNFQHATVINKNACRHVTSSEDEVSYTSNSSDIDDHYDVTTDGDYQSVLNGLDTKGRVLLSAPPGRKRTSFITALCRHFKNSGHTVYKLSSLSEWGKRGHRRKKGKSFVLVDGAFGVARLDMEQYHIFNRHNMHSTNSQHTKLVFLVYPNVVKALTQFDRLYHSPLLNNTHVITLHPQPPFSLSHYFDFIVSVLLHPQHGKSTAAVLALTLMGHGRFLRNVGQAQETLRSLGFETYPDAHLQEYAIPLQSVVLSDNGESFTDRAVYDAAGLALVATFYLDVALKVCDVRFLVQHVRTYDVTTNDDFLVVGLPSGDSPLLMERMMEDVVKGLLPEIVQHPCLHSPQFLHKFEQFCKEKDLLRRVMSAVDQQYGLSLLYWSLWGPTCFLTEWCLSVIMTQLSDVQNMSQAFVCSAFSLALVRNKEAENPPLRTTLCHEAETYIKLLSTTELVFPFITVEQRITESMGTFHTDLQLDNPLFYLSRPSLCIPESFLKVEVSDNAIKITFPEQSPYLAFRLLTDRLVDEKDSDGNTLLHLAADSGQLEVIKLAVNSGASLTVTNKAGLTPPQLAARRMARQDTGSQSDQEACFDLSTACATGDINTVKTLLCHSMTVDHRTKKHQTPLHLASRCGQTHIASLLTDLGADVNARDHLQQSPLFVACSEKHLDTARFLISKGADVNMQRDSGYSSLHVVCQNGNKDLAELLLQHNADVSLRCDTGHTPLAMACENSQWDVADLLVQYGADVNVSLSDHCVFTLLHQASHNGMYDTVHFLVRHKAQLDMQTSEGWKDRYLNLVEQGEGKWWDVWRFGISNSETAVTLACSRGYANIVQLLLDDGASVNTQREDGVTSLHVACYKGDTDIVQLLLDHGASVNTQCEDGVSALHVACYKGDTDIVQSLLNHGASVNTQREDGVTALHVACYKGNTDTVQILLCHNADVNVKEKYGKTPLHTASWQGQTEIVHQLLQHEEIDVNVKNNNGRTPLFTACQFGHTEIARLLLQHGKIKVSEKEDICSWSPLHVASVKGHTETVRLLVLHHADVNIPDHVGYTPLHQACENGHADIVNLLLHHKADVNATDEWGQTPLHVACIQGHADVVDHFLQNNTDVNNTDKRYGHTPLHKAYIPDQAQADLLLHYNPDITLTDKINGKTPPRWVRANVGCLDFNTFIPVLPISDRLDQTALRRACDYGHAEVVDLLLRNNADINVTDVFGDTPLHHACYYGRDDIVGLLLQNNADTSIKDKEGIAAMHLGSVKRITKTGPTLILP